MRTTTRHLFASGPSPCEEFNCPEIKKCREKRIACRAFFDYVADGKLREPSEPTRATFKKIYIDEVREDDMTKICKFAKRDHEKRITYAIVYEPEVPDSQGDIMFDEELEKTAHNFLAEARTDAIDIEHSGMPSGSKVVESFIAKEGDKDFATGAWVVGLKHTPEVWKDIKAGRFTGLSMEGGGLRKAIDWMGKKVKELYDVSISNISLVKRGANRKEFAIVKTGETSFDNAVSNLEKVVANLEQLNDKSISKEAKKVSKQEDREQIKKQERAEYLKRYIAHNHAQLFRLGESNPLPGQREREERLEARIDDAQAELAALGFEATDDEIMQGHSAFAGTTVVSFADPTLGHNTMGTIGDYANVHKASGPVGNNTMIAKDSDDDLDDIDLCGIKF